MTTARSIIPDKLKLKELSHGHGDHGRWHVTHGDLDDIGIVVVTSQESRRSTAHTKWMFRWLPNREFHSLQQMLMALDKVSIEDIKAEKAKWPVIQTVRDIRGREWPNKCIAHPDVPAVTQITLATCWIGVTQKIGSLCMECAKGEGSTAKGFNDLLQQRLDRIAAKREL